MSQITEKRHIQSSGRGNSLSSNSDQYHTRPDREERTFRCAECDASFSFKSDIIIHMSTHTGGSPVQCSECSNHSNAKGL